MKNLLLALFAFSQAITANAQIGIGTTSPNSTLDVRGSLSSAITTFTANTTAGSSDNMFVFTGTSAATLTLPTATGITGREYWIKNVSSNSSILTIATTSSQTIDGLTSWTLTQQNKAIRLVSNGSNWYATTESLPGSTGTPWVHGGNNVTSQQNIGTTSNYHLPFITNNTEKMRLTSTGSLGIGTSTFNATYPEKLLVDAGASGNTNYQNVIVGKGNTNSYAQLNIQNLSAGTAASSDVVATANNGDETNYYVDLGINSSGNTSGSMGVANDAYLYNMGQNFLIGTGTSGKVLAFLTGGTSQGTNERMRIGAAGNVAIGATSWDASNPEKLLVNAGTAASVHLIRGTANANLITLNSIKNSSAGASAGADFRVFNNADNSVGMGINSSGYSGSDILSGPADALIYSNANDLIIGNNVANKNLRFYTGGLATSNERMRISSAGNAAIGATAFNATYPERLLVDAGASGNTNYQNVIVGKGNTNSYAQLNIQNTNAGTSASSDVVATADNGNETTNYIDMGINSSANNSNVFGAANDAYLYNAGQNLLVGTATAGKSLVFMTGGSTQSTNERMRIDGSGNVGIGTNSPSQKFHLSGGNMRITNGGINADIMVGTTFGGITNAAGMVYYEIGGSEMHMFGGTILPDGDNSWTCGTSARRWSAVYAANGTIQTSDVRLKKNINPLSYGLNEVMQLKPVSYDWKDNSGSHKIGLIAQEVRKIVPEVVVGDENRENLGMNYAELVPVLVNAIKEQEQNMKNQQAQIDQLKKEIELLKNRKQ